MFVPSPQQSAVYDWIKTGHGSALVEAVAGSGKTTTLLEALSLMQGNIFFGAYNKAIAEEIAARAGNRPGLFVKTMHAAGFGAWRKVAPKVTVDANKCRAIFRDTQPVALASFESPVLKLVGLAKNAALGINGPDEVWEHQAWLDMIDHFDVDTMDNDDKVIELAREILRISGENDTRIVDFDDMIYAPLIHNARFYTYDWVLIDEAQDTNESRRALAMRMLKPTGRLIAVGDPHQAIYGFTGSDANSMDLIGKEVNAINLPLTVSYRCPKAVVTYAKNWVSHIEAAESAPEGLVDALEEPALVTTVKPGDAVLCRYNAPLIDQAYKLIAAGIPAKVEGREIGQGLKKLAGKWKVKTYDMLLTRLEAYEEREVAKFMAKEQKTRAMAVQDRVRCLTVLIDRAKADNPTPDNVVDTLTVIIDNIFGDEVGANAVVLTSIHKSKGREWNHVFWLQSGTNFKATKQWQLEQEDNLCYVAATRAKQTLTLIQLPVKARSGK